MIKEVKHRRRLQVERMVLQTIPGHPFLARLEYAFQNHSELFFLMDYCAGGDLCYQVCPVSQSIVQYGAV